MFKLSWAVYFAKKNKDNLFIAIGQSLPSLNSYVSAVIEDKGTATFRVLDLKKFSISDNYLVKNFGIEKQIEKFDMQHPMKAVKQMKGMNLTKLTKNNGFIISDIDYIKNMTQSFTGKAPSKADRQQAFYFYDLDFNKKWTYNLNQDMESKSFFIYNYFDGDGQDLVLIKKYFERKSDDISDISFDVLNAVTGQKKFEISLSDSEHLLNLDDFQFQKDKFVLFASIYDFDKNGEFQYSKKRGFVKISFDRTTGKQVGKEFVYWNTFAEKLDINESGKIKDYGFIQFLDFKILDNGKTVAIAEGYKPEGSTKILDLFAMVFDEKMKLIEFKKIDKTKNKIDKLEAYGRELENRGAFDYMYSQKLPNTNGYAFYYSDNEKEGARGRKDPKWILGVVTYIDGVFDFQKVPLTTKDGQIYPIKAKNGYVLLKEVPKKDSDKDVEFRLEKINY